MTSVYDYGTCNAATTTAGATAPSNPSKGSMWIDTSTATPVVKIYDGATWVITGGSGSSILVAEQQAIATAGQTTLTLNDAPVNDLLAVYLNGVLLTPGTDYTASGATVTFTVPLAVGDQILARYWKP